MKRPLFFIVFMFLITANYGQVINVDAYIANHSFFQELDLNLLNDYAQQYALKTIKEIKYTLDTNEIIVDTTLLYYYKFDELGQLTEKRWDFTKNDSLYVSIKFIYSDNNQKIDTIFNSPYSIEDVYKKYNYPNERESCVKTDKFGKVTELNTLFFDRKNSFAINFAIYYLGHDLIDLIIVLDKGKEYRHQIKYETYKKHQYNR